MPDLRSTTATVIDKVNSLQITQDVKAGIGKLTDAINDTFGYSTGLQIKSAFPSVDVPPAPKRLGGQTPEQARLDAVKFKGALVFPTEQKYFTMFKFSAYKRPGILNEAKRLPVVNIVLPMPNNLAENFAVNYETPALGPIVGSIADEIRGATGNGEQTEEKSVKGMAAQLAMLGVKKAITGKSEALNAALNRETGTAPNPHLATIFRNMSLRTHSFSYTLAPASEVELRTVKEIVKNLKYALLPGLTEGGDLLFTFPDTCEISFGPNADSPYIIKRSVLTNLNVNYTTGGSPAFFKTGDPVTVTIDMTFQEVDAFTRKDLKIV